jgi:protein-S-isoprenylcysteine O-methyltransferase Ste14
MTNEALLRILGYIWTGFGAYWMSFNVLKPEPGTPIGNSRRLQFAFLALIFVALFAGRHRIPPALILIFAVAWTSLSLYWGAPNKAAQSGESKWYRPIRLLVLAAVFALLFWNATAVGVLGKRFVPDLVALGVAGFIAAIAGMFVTSWARVALGNFWSDRVIVQTEHQLIRSGPYSCMRHPLYSGVLLAVLGTAVVLGEWRGLLSFTVLLVNYVIKAKREESILAERFGADFGAHLERTGFLLPRIRRP